MWTVQPTRLLKALGLKDVITTNDHEQIVLSPNAVFQDLIGGIALSDLDVSEYEDYVRSCRMMVRSLRLRRGETALVVNGRVRRSLFKESLLDLKHILCSLWDPWDQASFQRRISKF